MAYRVGKVVKTTPSISYKSLGYTSFNNTLEPLFGSANVMAPHHHKEQLSEQTFAFLPNIAIQTDRKPSIHQQLDNSPDMHSKSFS